MKVDLGGGITEGKEHHGPNFPRNWEDSEGSSGDGTVDKILWKLFIAPQAVRATAQPYPLSEKLEGPSPVCLLPAPDQLEGGDVIGDWASLPQLQWRRGDEGNMFYGVRYKPTWLQTSGTDIRSSENVSVTPAALRMRGSKVKHLQKEKVLGWSSFSPFLYATQPAFCIRVFYSS